MSEKTSNPQPDPKPAGKARAAAALTVREFRLREFDRATLPEVIEIERPRPDTRPGRKGAVIVGHSTRESFMRATGAPLVRCLFCPGFADGIDHLGGCPRREFVPAGAANAGLARAYAAKYGGGGR